MRKMLTRCLIAGLLALGALVVVAPAPARALAAPAALVRGPDALMQVVQYYGERRFYGGPRYYGRPRYYGPGPRYYARRGYYGGPRYYGGGPRYYGRGYYR